MFAATDLAALLPEAFMLGAICALPLIDLFIEQPRRGLTHFLAITTLVLAAILTLRPHGPADVDEADVGKLREAMEVEAVVDAFPGQIFHGTVQQVRYSPNNVHGVVTYSAVVEVQNPEEKLRPGMTATVTVKTKEAKNVIRVPNAALRFKPSPPLGPNGKPVPQAPLPPLPKGQGRVHVLLSEQPGDEKEEVRVVGIGITDGIHTEVTGLSEGAKVVTDEGETDDKKKKGKPF